MMMSTGSRNELTALEKEAVEHQLEHLLANPALSQSTRYQQLLKYIVGETLTNNTEVLKERTLGMEVFGRTPDYDTVKDPIVRVSVAALRKRLITYYLAPEHQGEIRIVIPVGTYVPQLIWPGSSEHKADEIPDSLAEHTHEGANHPEHPASEEHSGRRTDPRPEVDLPASPIGGILHSGIILFSSIGVVIALMLSVFVYSRTHHPTSPVSSFSTVWAPLAVREHPPLCAIGQSDRMNASDIDGAPGSKSFETKPDLGLMQYDDTDPLVRIVSHLQTVGSPCRLARSSILSLSDLRQGPDIFIGAFNNAWTLRLTAPLRFHFGNDGQSLWIEDQQTKTRWKRGITHQSHMVDYAIVARYQDNLTNEPTLVVAGLAGGGTIAAGQFVTDPEYISSLEKTIGAKALAGNFELVIETELIDGKPGSPQVVSTYSWQ
jgi:hypothetical protein